MEILDPKVLDATRRKLDDEMTGPVTLVHFTQESRRLIVPDYLKGQDCIFCRETKSLLNQVSGLSDKISLEMYDFTADAEKARSHGVDKIPATLVWGADKASVRFFGIPSGYEYASFIEAVIDASRGETSLSPKTKEALQKLDRTVHIQVFVTPTCPYCTAAVRLAHQFAVESSLIVADMVETTEFPHLAQKYGVAGVPRTVINETENVDGAVPEEVFLDHVLKSDRLAAAARTKGSDNDRTP